MANQARNRVSARNALLLVTAILAATATLSGCGAGASRDAYGGDMSATADMVAPEAMEAQADFGVEESAGSPSSIDVGMTVITSGSATIQTRDPGGAAVEFAEQIAQLGGTVDNTWSSEWEGTKSASVDARVPADKYQEAHDLLPGLGRVLDEQTSRQDVGLQLSDLNARKDVLESSIARLTELMEQATTTEELLQAEDSLTQRQAELDSLNQQLDWLNRQVEMSSLYVNFTQSTAGQSGFSWAKAWESIVNSFRVVAYVLIVAIPWLLIAALVAWLVLLIVRRVRRPHPAAAVGPVARVEVVEEKVRGEGAAISAPEEGARE